MMGDIARTWAPENGIGLIGAGAMGTGLIRHLVGSSVAVFVYDQDKDAAARGRDLGATSCSSPSEVGDHAQVVLLSLPGAAEVEACMRGPHGLGQGVQVHTVVNLSTVGSEGSRVAAEAAAEMSLAYVDAPVSGGPDGAARGALTTMVAAPSDLLEQLDDLLNLISGRVLHVSQRPGDGQLAKVLNNLLSATAIAITSEALVEGVLRGLDPIALLEVFNASSGRNTATETKFPHHVLTRTFDFGFKMDLMLKDLDLALAEFASSRLPAPVSRSVHEMWRVAVASSSESGSDSTAFVQVIEEWAGVRVGEP